MKKSKKIIKYCTLKRSKKLAYVEKPEKWHIIFESRRMLKISENVVMYCRNRLMLQNKETLKTLKTKKLN